MWRSLRRSLVKGALLTVLCASVASGVAVVPTDSSSPHASRPESLSNEQARSEEEALFAIPTRIDRVGRIIVPVTINGQGPFRFIVDTGAGRCTVSPDVVTRPGLSQDAGAEIEVNGITGTAQVPAVAIANLRAGNLAIDAGSFPVVSAPIMAGVDGILGAAGLTTQRLSVDFEHNKVALSDAGVGSTPLGFIRVRAQRINGGLMAVPAHVGRISVIAVIDTGSERTLGNIALRDAMNVVPRPGLPMAKTTVYGATSDAVLGETQVAPTISIEQLRITDVTLTYGDFHIFEVWQMRSVPALIIGMDILGTVAGLTIDFKNQYVYFQGRGLLSTSGADTLHHYNVPHMGNR